MAKSLRAKKKMASRALKRTDSHYAIVDAARTARLSAKLLGSKSSKEEQGKEGKEEDAMDADVNEVQVQGGDVEMDVEAKPEKKVSTSGPRGNRREEWRASKGMDPRPKSKGVNKFGQPKARVKAGRPLRRR